MIWTLPNTILQTWFLWCRNNVARTLLVTSAMTLLGFKTMSMYMSYHCTLTVLLNYITYIVYMLIRMAKTL